MACLGSALISRVSRREMSFNVLTDAAATAHSVKMIDEALTWSDAGLEVRLYF